VVEAKASSAEVDAKVAKSASEVAELKALPPSLMDVSTEQLAVLQARLEGLRAAKLLTKKELYTLEDLVGDYVELQMSMADQAITTEMVYASLGQDAVGAARNVPNLVGLSTAIASDEALARQLRHKCPIY
jgi:hypothetical protein